MPAATSSSSRTPTSSTTPPSIPVLQPILEGGRRRLRLPVPGRARPPRPLLPALRRQPVLTFAVQHAHGPEPHRHGDLLQGLAPRGGRQAGSPRTAFGIEPEITAKVARLRRRFYEVPISYRGRTYGEGKKIGWKDGVGAFWAILRFFRWEAPRQDLGAMTLRRMANLAGYNAWLHRLFGPYLGRRILEVGSGLGNQTRFFLDRERVVASDIEPHYQMELRAKFGDRANVRVAAFRLPLSDAERSEALSERPDRCLPQRPGTRRRRRRRGPGFRLGPRAGRPAGPSRPGHAGSLRQPGRSPEPLSPV